MSNKSRLMGQRIEANRFSDKPKEESSFYDFMRFKMFRKGDASKGDASSKKPTDNRDILRLERPERQKKAPDINTSHYGTTSGELKAKGSSEGKIAEGESHTSHTRSDTSEPRGEHQEQKDDASDQVYKYSSNLGNHDVQTSSFKEKSEKTQESLDKLQKPIEDANNFVQKKDKFAARKNDLGVRLKKLQQLDTDIKDLDSNIQRAKSSQTSLKGEFDHLKEQQIFSDHKGHEKLCQEWLENSHKNIQNAEAKLQELRKTSDNLTTRLNKEKKQLRKEEKRNNTIETIKEALDLRDLFVAKKSPYFPSREQVKYPKTERQYEMVRSELPDSCVTNVGMMMLHDENKHMDVKSKAIEIRDLLHNLRNTSYSLGGRNADSYAFKRGGAKVSDLPDVLKLQGSQKNWQYKVFNESTTFTEMKAAQERGPIVASIHKKDLGGHAIVVDSISGTSERNAMAAVRDPYNGSFYKVSYSTLAKSAKRYVYNAG